MWGTENRGQRGGRSFDLRTPLKLVVEKELRTPRSSFVGFKNDVSLAYSTDQWYLITYLSFISREIQRRNQRKNRISCGGENLMMSRPQPRCPALGLAA